MQKEEQMNRSFELKSFYISSLLAEMVNNYYLVLIASYFACVFLNIRPAVIMFVYNLILLILNSVLVFKTKVIKLSIVLIYLIWCFLSLLMFMFNGMPLSVFFSSLLYMGSPMICFFCTNREKIQAEKFYLNFAIAILLNDIFGTICFYSKPGFFVSFITRTSDSASDQLLHLAGAGRLITLFGSIETGLLSALAIIIGLGFYIHYRAKKKLSIVVIVVCSISMVLTQQRGPMFTIILVICFLIVYSLKERLIKPRIIILIVLVSSLVLLILSKTNTIVFNWIVERMSNPASAITERTDYQFDHIYSNYNLFQIIFGNGIGSCEMFARPYSSNGLILDAMYLNILGEVGVIGLLLFICILFKSFARAFKNLHIFFIPLFVVFAFAFVGLGTTLLYYPQIVPVFWFSVGVLFNNLNVFEVDETKINKSNVD